MIRGGAASAALVGLDRTRVAETSFAALLVAHHDAASTGALLARRGPVEKRVALERGVPVDCRSNLAHETLSRYLVSLGRLKEGDANALLAESAWRGVLVGRVLTERGLLDASELTRVLQQNLAKKLLDLFTWPDGEIRFAAGPAESNSALKVKVPQLVLTGVTRFAPQAVIDRAVLPLASAAFVRSPEATARLGELRLAERESKLLAALERPRRIEELMTAAGLEPADAARSLTALVLLGLALPETEIGQRTTPPRQAPAPPRQTTAEAPPPSPAPAPPAKEEPSVTPVAAKAPSTPPAPALSPLPPSAPAPAAAPAPPERAELLNRVSRAFLDHRRKDAFELLELTEEVTPAELEARFLAFAREFAPWRFAEPGLRLVEEYARELFLAGVHSYAELADPARRTELALRRKLAREEGERAKRAAHHHIDTDLLDPALQFKKGMLLFEAGKLKAAVQQLEFAADCDPQNGGYRAELARCRFALSPATAGRQALEDLKEAERVDPTAVEPFLYHGEIAAELARWDEAEAAYRAAAKLLGPTDRRALDALRDLAPRRKKKR